MSGQFLPNTGAAYVVMGAPIRALEGSVSVIAVAATQLAEASKAWSDLKHAEREISRLQGYTNRSRAMRQDLHSHYETAHKARATLNAVLKAVP